MNKKSPSLQAAGYFLSLKMGNERHVPSILSNKKAGIGEILTENVLYLILLFVFFTGMTVYLNNQKDGAGVWEDYYAKELVKIINSAQVGDEIALNVHQATIVAQKRGSSFDNIFSFDNNAHLVCVQLSIGRKTCYAFYNDVRLENQGLRLGLPENVLYFKILPRQAEATS